MRKLFWLSWSIVWVAVMKIMAIAQLVPPNGLGWMILDCVVSCFAAWIFSKNKLLRIIAVIYMTVKLIMNFNIVGITCYALSMLLLIATIFLNPRKRRSTT